MNRLRTAMLMALVAVLASVPSAGWAAEHETKLKVALTAQPPTLDPPLTVSQAALDVAQNFFETLYTQDGNFKPTPMLAKSCEISDDRRTYTFRLREGVLFHNGKEMDADDVTASMNYWLEKSARSLTAPIHGAAAPFIRAVPGPRSAAERRSRRFEASRTATGSRAFLLPHLQPPDSLYAALFAVVVFP